MGVSTENKIPAPLLFFKGVMEALANVGLPPNGTPFQHLSIHAASQAAGNGNDNNNSKNNSDNLVYACQRRTKASYVRP